MSETQQLLGKIAALRQRLEQAQVQAGRTRLDGASANEPVGPGRLWALQQHVEAAHEHALQLDQAVKALAPADSSETPRPLPTQLTVRARKVLERGRDLLTQLRGLSGEQPLHDPDAPLARVYREATTLTETALRMAQLLPDRAAGQFAVCEGMEVLLGVVSDKLCVVKEGLADRRLQSSRLEQFAGLLLALERGRAVDPQPFLALAEALIDEAASNLPIRFHDAPVWSEKDIAWVARCVAAHGLTVAQVVARMARLSPELRGRHLEAVLAGLLHDVGMLCVPAELLWQAVPLDDAGRRTIEGHCQAGAALLMPLMPDAAWLHEAAGGHHERLDGTGYPDGRKGTTLGPITRLVAVCDVYAAACTARPYRPARDTRTALTDTLLLAESGALDRDLAERLLHLSFYPTGSVVELADGSVGLVVATPTGRREQANPARPVVAQLTTPQSEFLAAPRFLDLAACDGPGIIRSLSPEERRRVLSTRYPQWT